MKRNQQVHVINIDWNYCFICQRKQKTNITNTDKTLKTVASNTTDFRNLGELDLEWDAINEIIDENGNRVHTILYESLKKITRVSTEIVARSSYNKQKLERLTIKRENVKQRSSWVRRSSVEKRDSASLFCAICNQTDSPENLHTRGSFPATKRSANAKNNKEVTENWKSMSLKVG